MQFLNFPIIILCLIFTISCSSKESDRLVIATAANVQYAMDDLKADFELKAGMPCDLVISSSGKLTAQIRQGAPYDLFVSADMKYPSALYKEGLAMNPPEIYAYGKVVLFSTIEQPAPSIELLTSPEIQHIAIANPKTAPYGAAIIQVLKHFGIYETIKDKLVFGESIAQTTQYVISNAADLGFTALSVVLSPEIKHKVQWTTLADEAYDPIKQGVVMIKKAGNMPDEDAKKFYDYLKSDPAKNILNQYGYNTITAQ